MGGHSLAMNRPMFVVIVDYSGTINPIGPFDHIDEAVAYAHTVPSVFGPIVAEIEDPEIASFEEERLVELATEVRPPTQGADGSAHLTYFDVRSRASFIWDGGSDAIQVCIGGYGEPVDHEIPVDMAMRGLTPDIGLFRRFETICKAHAETLGMARQIAIVELYEAAVELLSEDGENPEYDRGLVEMIAELDYVKGLPLNNRADQIAIDLRRRRKERGW